MPKTTAYTATIEHISILDEDANFDSQLGEGVMTDEELEVYRDAFTRPGALSAMLRWYRAAARLPGGRLAHPRVEQPVCLIWGKKDEALGWEMAAPSMSYCDDGRLFMLEDAGHFVQHDEPRRVAALLLDFLGPASNHT